MTLFDDLERYLQDDDASATRFLGTVQERRLALQGEERARSWLIERLATVLEAWREEEGSDLDVAVLVRGVIRACARRLWLPRELWGEIAGEAERCGVFVTEERDGAVEVFAAPWKAEWVPGTEECDRVELRRKDRRVIGDAHVFGMRGSTTYQSEAQKAAVDAALFAPEGSTTLVTLPTGAGKSTCVQIPAWVGMQGGGAWAKTILVVVPTVALALDQQRQAAAFFTGNSASTTPQAWWSGTSVDDRDAIVQGLLNGTLPLLFTSPESLAEVGGGTRLYDACAIAAERGYLTHLAIDEAHIVESWGEGFRTEFQMLSAFRRVVLERSERRLRTLLLSATVGDKAERDLESLFSEGELRVVRANRLRPEPAYWMALFERHAQRKTAVLEALRHVQRPAILYVNFPDHAEDWIRVLREEGYRRVAQFTGRTPNDERSRLIYEWQRGRIDIMVATKAFGLGVDKEDIRSVIHACVPEGLDRMYQEVGRGGRDGCGSVSLLVATRHDLDEFKVLGLKGLISTERALERWEGLRASARPFGDRGDEQLLNMDAFPVLETGESNERHREWNEHIVLLMQRAGLLHVLDTQVTDEELPAGAWLPVRYLKPDSITDEKPFEEELGKARDSEFDEKRRRVRDLFSAVTCYADGSAEECLAYRLTEQYPSSALACGGCPVCRREGRAPYTQELPLRMDMPADAAPSAAAEPLPSIQALLNATRSLSIMWEGKREVTRLKGRRERELLAALIARGNFQQLFLPGAVLEDDAWCDELIHGVAPQESIPHLIVPTEWIEDLWDRPFYPLPTIVVYPPDDEGADRVHEALLCRLREQPHAVPLIGVAHRDTYLRSQGGRYVDRVDGLTLGVCDAIELLTPAIYI